MTKPKFSLVNYHQAAKLRADNMKHSADQLQKALDAMTRARVCQTAEYTS